MPREPRKTKTDVIEEARAEWCNSPELQQRGSLWSYIDQVLQRTSRGLSKAEIVALREDAEKSGLPNGGKALKE